MQWTWKPARVELAVYIRIRSLAAQSALAHALSLSTCASTPGTMKSSLVQTAFGLALALPTLCSASPASKVDRFRSLSRNGLVKLDSALYDEITEEPRDYSVSVVLTAMAPQFKCAPCQ